MKPPNLYLTPFIFVFFTPFIFPCRYREHYEKTDSNSSGLFAHFVSNRGVACGLDCCWHLNRLSHTDTGKSRDQCRSFLCESDGFGRGDHAALHICHAHQMPSMWWSRLHAQREEQNAPFPSNPVQMRILQADTLDEGFCLRQPVSRGKKRSEKPSWFIHHVRRLSSFR